MRLTIAALGLVSAFSLPFSLPARARDKKGAACPSSAQKASRSLWARGAIRTGQTTRGTHPCGRQIECTGGRSTAGGSRTCRWL